MSGCLCVAGGHELLFICSVSFRCPHIYIYILSIHIIYIHCIFRVRVVTSDSSSVVCPSVVLTYIYTIDSSIYISLYLYVYFC